MKRITVPQQLQELTFAEKQLIALATSHMNLVHLKNGTLGSTGHVVALEQNISDIAITLPRLPSEVNIVTVVRKGMNSKQEVFEKMFKVRKQKVIYALEWLVKHNTLYREYAVTIDESRLDWMGTQAEAVIPVINEVELDSADDNGDDDGDLGPSPTQTLTDVVHNTTSEFEVSGKFIYVKYMTLILLCNINTLFYVM